MASRSGPRATGTDGNDFMHRERIAPRHELSTQNKTYVKFAIYMHFMISVVILLQLASANFNILVDLFPQPGYWEYIWILSLFASIAGYLSLNRNRLNLLKIYYYGTIGFGLGPILFTMLFNATDLWQYVQTKQTKNLFNGFPVIVLWYIFLFIAIQIHSFGIYFTRILIKAWSGNSNLKKRN